MPRERIQHGKLYVDIPNDDPETKGLSETKTVKYHPGDDIPPEAKVREEQSLEVNWNRDGGWVQLSIVAPYQWWEKAVDPDHFDVHGAPYQSVYTDVLSRSEINHLIKTLRRARDAAYGADE
ncbi:hypothetical protein QEH42_gp288 [Microbacterium phage Pumpernickel]|uniref:Uncharacterized protein n=1 Tax=Microbacterium phage Pumpernickel TaxID=2885983 RepID=A0AAE8Y774_9CAUD|nr:hypothetical protein QEH42_gp288 [Microbacterium phage Pumpernickel]UDL15930.1 hypothetical protein SEA_PUMPERNICKEL_177 [Microbacterium phage Pumpernickel]